MFLSLRAKRGNLIFLIHYGGLSHRNAWFDGPLVLAQSNAHHDASVDFYPEPVEGFEGSVALRRIPPFSMLK